MNESLTVYCRSLDIDNYIYCKIEDCRSRDKLRFIIKNASCVSLDIFVCNFIFVPEVVVYANIVDYKRTLRALNRLFRFCGWFGSEPSELLLRGLCFKVFKDPIFIPVDSYALAILAYYPDSSCLRISLPSNSGMVLESKKDVIRHIFNEVWDDIDKADFYFDEYTYKRFFRASIPLSSDIRRILI